MRTGGFLVRIAEAWRQAVFVALAILVTAPEAAAHGLGMSDVTLRVRDAHIEGTWVVPLRDARWALGLDGGVQGEPGWRDVVARDAELRAYFATRFAMAVGDAPCLIAATEPPEWLEDMAQVRLSWGAACPTPPRDLAMRCGLLFDRDASHRVYYSVEDDRTAHAGIFRSDEPTAIVDIRQFRYVAGFLEFAREGVLHIWTGLDHVLFLLTLLLPAALLRSGDAWRRREGLLPTLREALKVITAFTAAHSITLALSFFGWVFLPAHWVEAGIALSIFAAAWNNLRPFLAERAWTMAFAFGLLHGLGFAGALRNLALPLHARGFALLAFNVGVEAGQIAVLALVLPLLYAASRQRAYPRVVMGVGSLAIAWFAALLTLQRALGLPFVPGL